MTDEAVTGIENLSQEDRTFSPPTEFVQNSVARPSLYTEAERDYEAWMARNACPENDRLCDEMVWLPQNLLLAGREAMDDIADAIAKIGAHAEALATATRIP